MGKDCYSEPPNPSPKFNNSDSVWTTVPSHDTVRKCKYCGSRRIRARGTRHNKSGDVVRMACRDCGRTFSANIGFRYRRHPKEVITEALRLYYSGMSTRQISENFAARGIKVSNAGVYKWIQRYSKLATKYSDSLAPAVGDRYRADEVWVNVEGKKHYLFATMDDSTRYWIASDLSGRKQGHDAESLFRRTVERTGKYPDEMITDGLNSYKEAARRVFQGMTRHTSEIHITGMKKGKDNNNRMERLNGTIRDREKTFRGIGTRHTACFEGLRVHYNHARRHGSLGMTPGEAAGIRVEGADKWRTLIQNGSLHLIRTNSRV